MFENSTTLVNVLTRLGFLLLLAASLSATAFAMLIYASTRQDIHFQSVILSIGWPIPLSDDDPADTVHEQDADRV